MAALSVDTRQLPARRTLTPQRSGACALVTRADVEQAIGRAVDTGAEESDGPASTCDYRGAGGLVSITIQPLSRKADRAVEAAALRKEVPEGVWRDTRAFADAFYYDLPGAGTQLHVLNGERQHLMVSILGFGEPEQVSAAAERIARKALGRL